MLYFKSCEKDSTYMFILSAALEFPKNIQNSCKSTGSYSEYFLKLSDACKYR